MARGCCNIVITLIDPTNDRGFRCYGLTEQAMQEFQLSAFWRDLASVLK